jgi:23S rRNA (cytidine1920-2'-O)/16S rRNA (cytidine1409-2'-O)-methyltransferase
MGRKGRRSLRRLVHEVARALPEIADPDREIRTGAIVVDGRVMTNPATLVRDGASIARRVERPLRGEAKLRAALEAFAVGVRGRIALDAGAAAGGFTRVLLEAGARRVYAVDAGHGQLLGSLRQDARVVNLEATNLARLDRLRVPDTVELVTVDLSYLALAAAVPLLERVRLDGTADAVALVKPQFELGAAVAPTAACDLERAVARARAAFEANGWSVAATTEAPVRGRNGAIEHLLHARRAPAPTRRARAAAARAPCASRPPPGCPRRRRRPAWAPASG